MTPVIRTTACVSGISIERGVTLAEMREHLALPENVVWMDVQSPGADEIAMLCAEFGFHPMSLKDAGTGRHRPKLDARKNYIEMVIYAVLPGATEGEVKLAEIDLFIGKNFIVTVHSGPVPAVDEAMQHWSKGGAMLREGIGFPYYCVLEAAVAGFAPTIASMEEIVEDPQLDIASGTDERNVERLLAMKRTLFSLRRVLYPMRDSVH
ncbi:MAG: hypothetical protein H7X80_09300, partial [bacterium]|nr:hypothetical protein [Candidatus Kapabacteria bacterium]